MIMDLTAILQGVPWTIALTLASFVLGGALGLPLCAMRLSTNGVLRLTSTAIVVSCRSIPDRKSVV